MISTIKPYGAIREREISFLTLDSNINRFFIVDNSSNQWEISENDFNNLHSHGFEIKEVRIR